VWSQDLHIWYTMYTCESARRERGKLLKIQKMKLKSSHSFTPCVILAPSSAQARSKKKHQNWEFSLRSCAVPLRSHTRATPTATGMYAEQVERAGEREGVDERCRDRSSTLAASKINILTSSGERERE